MKRPVCQYQVHHRPTTVNQNIAAVGGGPKYLPIESSYLWSMTNSNWKLISFCGLCKIPRSRSWTWTNFDSSARGEIRFFHSRAAVVWLLCFCAQHDCLKEVFSARLVTSKYLYPSIEEAIRIGNSNWFDECGIILGAQDICSVVLEWRSWTRKSEITRGVRSFSLPSSSSSWSRCLQVRSQRPPIANHNKWAFG